MTDPARLGPPGCEVAGLRHAITSFNASGSGDIAPQPGCTYTVVNADNDGNAMPVITGNTVGGTGGGVYVASGHVSDIGSTISGNTPNNCAPAGAVPGCTG